MEIDAYRTWDYDYPKTDMRIRGLIQECGKILNLKANFHDCKCHKPHKDKACYHLRAGEFCDYLEGRDDQL